MSTDNNNYDRYLDMLMRNYPLMNDSSDEELEYRYKIKQSKNKTKSVIQKGGRKHAYEVETNQMTNGDVPYGGFPPIFLCKSDTKTIEELGDNKKEREYSKHKTAVSIKDIMKKRRDITPFVSV
jgi:shikimate kinase